MKQPTKKVRIAQRPLWDRILGRYRFKRRLLRPRVQLVLFRFGSPGASRQAYTGMRVAVANYPLNLKLQFFWQQSINKASVPRALIERFVATHSVTKQLKLGWENPRQTEHSQLSHEAVPGLAGASKAAVRIGNGRQAQTHSAPASLFETAASIEARATRSPVPPLHNALAPPEQGAIVPQNFRLLNERVLTNRMHKVISERNIFPTSAARISRPVHTRYSVPEAGASSSPIVDANTPPLRTISGGRATRAFRSRNGTDISAPERSQFIHSARTDGSAPEWLPNLRSRLFAESAWLNLSGSPASRPPTQPQSREPASTPQPLPAHPPMHPQLDIGRLSEEVYRHIQRKVRIERERRGI